MTFIQTMEFSTDDAEKMLEAGNRWADDAITAGTAKRGVLARDRATPDRFVWTVFFDSAEDAARNNERPETGSHAEEFGALTTGGITFSEYDLVTVHGD